jgi:hypothetical protein
VCEGWRIAQRFQVAEELELSRGVGFLQSFQEQAAE